MLQVKIDSKEVVKHLNKISKSDIPNALNSWIKKALISVQGEAKREVPRDKGILGRGILYKQQGSESGEVYNNVSYSDYVHEGTKAHIITAKGGGLMRPGAPHPMKSVKHPGTKANPYFTRALSNQEDNITSLLFSTIKSFISK